MTHFTDKARIVYFKLRMKIPTLSEPEAMKDDIEKLAQELEAEYKRGRAEMREECAVVAENSYPKLGANYDTQNRGLTCRQVAIVIRSIEL